ncbi:hypothetical protein Tco_0650052 [Tanacetum coccineum]
MCPSLLCQSLDSSDVAFAKRQVRPPLGTIFFKSTLYILFFLGTLNPPAGPNQGKKTKRRRTKESKSSKKPSTTKETPKGKAPSKGYKTGKSASAKELVEEPIVEVVMDDADEEVVRNDDQPQDTSKPKIAKTPNPEWFKPPLRPPTLDLE